MRSWSIYLCSLLLIASSPLVMKAQQEIHATPNGIRATSKGVTLEVTALQDDKLRVRQWRSSVPEDASWAVPPASRNSRVAATPDGQGFHTAKLKVKVGDDLQLVISDLEGHILQEDAKPTEWRDEGFKIYKRRSDKEHFFGLGDKPGPLDRAGESFTLWNTDSFGWQESTDPIYKSIPFFLGVREGRYYGVLFDNTWRTSFDFGHENEEVYSFGSPGGPVDYYFLYGPEPREVMRAYAWLTGPSPLPPLWSFGFQQSRYSYSPESQLMEVAARLRKDRIPADALWLDIDFQKDNMPFTVDPQRFPNFPEMVTQLARNHFRLIVIADLHIAQKPNAGYAPYDSGIAGDYFVKNPDGTTYVGPVWPGPSVFPDFTRQQARQWFGTLYKDFVKDGVAGFWDDMNEPAVFRYPSKTMPLDVQHRIEEPGFVTRTAGHREVHNLVGMQNSRATYDGVLALRPNERPYVMTRASYAGGQRYAVTWTGDNSSTWNHLKMTIPQLMNLGLSGFSFAGADVGGFAGSPPADLLTKWLEVAAFQPIDRDHSAKGTRMHEPWVDGPKHEAMRRRYIEERYRLLPYIYTVAEETYRDGMPMMRPLFLEFPHATPDGTPMDLIGGGAEFLLGPDVLVAPNPSPEEIAPYELHLPPGRWYDYWTGIPVGVEEKAQARDAEVRDLLTQSKQVMLKPEVSTVPIYVRGGAILPMQNLIQNTDEVSSGPLILRIFIPEKEQICQGSVYSDDGHTLEYRQGNYYRINAACRLAPDGTLTVTLDVTEGRYQPQWKNLRLELVGVPHVPSAALIDGRRLPITLQNGLPAVTFGIISKSTEILFR